MENYICVNRICHYDYHLTQMQTNARSSGFVIQPIPLSEAVKFYKRTAKRLLTNDSDTYIWLAHKTCIVDKAR